MKNSKIAFFLFLFVSVQWLTSCNPDDNSVIETVNAEESGDSLVAANKRLKQELAMKDSAINQSIRMFNEIEENLSQIGRKQGLIGLNPNGNDPEITDDKKSRIIEEITAINTLLQENKEKVNVLRSKLKKADVKIGELEKMLENIFVK